jgi:hypothetical protein
MAASTTIASTAWAENTRAWRPSIALNRPTSSCVILLKIASTPNFELYLRDFNPATGLGGIEIWMPLEG